MVTYGCEFAFTMCIYAHILIMLGKYTFLHNLLKNWCFALFCFLTQRRKYKLSFYSPHVLRTYTDSITLKPFLNSWNEASVVT